MNSSKRPTHRGLLERLSEGTVICAEGYVFELERRGYLQAGSFVPEVVLEHPEVVAQLHREFVRAGSDVVEALTYYGHREKLRLIGKEDLLEPLNHAALDLARTVADEVAGEPALVAGNICNSNIYHPDGDNADTVRGMFEEQVGWAADHAVDFVIGETFYHLGEARLALAAIKRANLAAVITLVLSAEGTLADGPSVTEAAKILEQEGADVVGMNCSRGPHTMLPFLRDIREGVSCHVAALPVPYRTSESHPTFFTFTDADDLVPVGRPFPTALEPFQCNRYEMANFAQQMQELDIRYIGICCGNAPSHTRAMAEALGRHPEASKYSPDLSKHWVLGDDRRLDKASQTVGKRL